MIGFVLSAVKVKGRVLLPALEHIKMFVINAVNAFCFEVLDHC
jgi:hypothetical protein